MSQSHSRTVRFEDEYNSVVTSIVKSVAAILNKEPRSLPPLSDTIDVDVVERSMDLSDSEAFDGGEIAFTYEGVAVTVDLTGEVHFEWE